MRGNQNSKGTFFLGFLDLLGNQVRSFHYNLEMNHGFSV